MQHAVAAASQPASPTSRGPRCPTEVRRSTREQADLPAEQPAPGQDPRLPFAHAHPCRSRHPLRSSPQGPLQPVRLRPAVLPAPNRLRERADFTSAVRSSGGGRPPAPALLPVVHATSTDTRAGLPPRVGFVVSKAVGDAVVRNRTSAGCGRWSPTGSPASRAVSTWWSAPTRRRPPRPLGNSRGPRSGQKVDRRLGGACASIGRVAGTGPDLAGPRLPAGALAPARPTLPVLPVVLGLRRQGAEHARRPARHVDGWPAGCCAATRGTRVASTTFRQRDLGTGSARCPGTPFRAAWATRRTGILRDALRHTWAASAVSSPRAIGWLR